MGHDLDEEELRATRRMFGLDKKENKVISREFVDQNYVSKKKIRELYEEYKDTGYIEIEYILQELLGE